MTYISAALRRSIIERAGNCCEYCLRSQENFPFPYHVEHILAEKHGGATTSENLCLSCPDCNTFKGTDLASNDPLNGQLTRLFNPRTQNWTGHFRLDGAIIQPITPEGRVTVFLLQMNRINVLEERTALIRLGDYPCISRQDR